tara:strand:+ start:440 stop:1159 length:720 start_codon:yes stop_codon:yes gene_type:complete
MPNFVANGTKQVEAGFSPNTKQKNAMSRPKEVFIDGESIKDASGDERIKFTDTGDFTVVSDTATAAGAGVSAAATNNWLVETTNGITITTGQVDITGLASIAGDNTVIGNAGTTDANSYLTKITHEINGYIFDVKVVCVEAPTTGEPDIDFTFDTTATAAQTAADDQQLEVNADWTLGLARHWSLAGVDNNENESDGAAGFTAGLDDYFLHLTSGKGGSTVGTYDAGKFVIRLLGNKVF